MLILTQENYDKTVQDNEIVVIDFWAQWCAPCKQYGPIFEKVSEKYPDITFAKLHTEEETKLSDYFFVQNLPTTVFMKEKTVVFKTPGLLSEEELVDLIEQTKATDMDKFRAERAAKKAARKRQP
ncbi:MAG: thioredoxin family protein [Sulfuricurvum sp.]|uniref:thioredoxin family protein n=1 Tax=Sulfuricurvum sp. TaxID=2025608 RepID=UPI00261163F9|nr:thioredoxin family protein [Sulfuricurvum sp.]MDD3595495.1 thioredoxin family protein [Sulfuricurvum sp.]MDD4884175.1 thioredoxin family protein [Sulfuricurvum sp.]